MRKCGVLMPVASLPSRFGIGGFSKEAYDFVDFLEQGGQSLWQIQIGRADPATGADGIWRLSLPVLLDLCRQSLLYQSGCPD